MWPRTGAGPETARSCTGPTELRTRARYRLVRLQDGRRNVDDVVELIAGAGKHQVRMEFAYDGSGLAKGGDVTLYYDGTAVGTGRVEKNQPMGYSADEACDVGSDSSSPASPDYGPTGNRFTGEIEWVQLDIGEDSHDHLITAEERFNLAMARQ
jgi:hypothetical protein